MPYSYRAPEPVEPTVEYEFWIVSSRGTDHKEVLPLPAEWDEEDIKHELEQWCEQFGAWHVSENFVRYGYRRVKK